MTDELRGVRLRPFYVDPDLPWLHELVDRPEHRDQWHQHGRRSSLDAFAHSFDWQADGHLVAESRSGDAIGYHHCYSIDATNGHAAVAVIYDECSSLDRGLGLDLFFNYLFMTYPLRKVYAEVVDFNLPQLGSAVGELFREEGRLRQHVFCRGAYRDVVHLSMSRDAYADQSLIGLP